MLTDPDPWLLIVLRRSKFVLAVSPLSTWVGGVVHTKERFSSSSQEDAVADRISVA